MAPILATALGITPQMIDDERLQEFIRQLRQLELSDEQPCIEQLVSLLEPHQQWMFEEQVDLNEWIYPLNLIDAAIRWILAEYPHLLLVAPVERKRGHNLQPAKSPAQSVTDADSVPTRIKEQLFVLLRFLAALLRNSSNKSLFNSVEELADLLAASDDQLAHAALAVLQALSLPPLLHKQQGPEVQSHTTALHNSKTTAHARLVALARGWGTRAMGLGLHAVVTADDSVHGQGSLPPEAGHVYFTYYDENDDDSDLVRIALTETEILQTGVSSDEESNKRRKVGSRKETKSTADLFFLALKKAGRTIPSERFFSLLADIRLAKAFYAQYTRIEAVEIRLRALITILHAHPSPEVMSGYFQAQPELCVEVVDLLRPALNSANMATGHPSTGRDAIAALSSSLSVPYSTRMLALEALTALVSRRDGSTGALSGSARLSSILTELGVGKGQYLGTLPTLLRYSLASLGAGVVPKDDQDEKMQDVEEDAVPFDIGMAFVEATMPPLPPRKVQVQQALDFIDSVLTLTGSVISTPTGTSSLTESGLVPALLTTISMSCDETVERLLLSDVSSCSSDELKRIQASLRFITAQAVQILEGAVVTHGNALTAFHDLQGIDMLVSRLSREILSRAESGDDMDTDELVTRNSVELRASHRVLLFSIVTCLTVVFHQESTSSTNVLAPSGGAQLRKPELTRAIKAILADVAGYGGNLVALVATLLSDVMNSDPHIVHYVHSSGIATSFMNMVLGEKATSLDGREIFKPILPPVPDLIMGVPNVLAALALTEDGAKAVYETNPFPSLLKIFQHPDYAMPNSRCLLNEMTAIVGTGLDEIMRHVDSMKSVVLKAIAQSIVDLVDYANDLRSREHEIVRSTSGTSEFTEIDNERSFLIQYVLNYGQLLEQILHNEDHCEPFVDAGGLQALLNLFPATMPSRFLFLNHVSCLSSPSVGTLHHSTIEDSLSVALKSIQFRYDPTKLIQLIASEAQKHLDGLSENAKKLSGGNHPSLDAVPCVPVYKIKDPASIEPLSDYLRSVAIVQWVSNLLASTLKAANQRSTEYGNGWNRAEREWKSELSRDTFLTVLQELAELHQWSIFQVCRSRSQLDYENRENERYSKRLGNLRFRIRIVCPEGAVVRDGVEIDSCASVGSMEMGEIVDSFDRCINSSGILRYRARRGWISEMTRGHGREPIAEVIDVWESTKDDFSIEDIVKRRSEAGIPDLQSVAVGVLARMQSSYSELFSAISKVAVQSCRSLSPGSFSFEEGTQAHHVSQTLKVVGSTIQRGLSLVCNPSAISQSERITMSDSGVAMYLGCILSHVHSCLFDEKRERRVVNVPLLAHLISHDSFARSVEATDEPFLREYFEKSPPSLRSEKFGIFDAIRFIFLHALEDFKRRQDTSKIADGGRPSQRVSRSVAASFPSVVNLLRRLVTTPIASSPVASVMCRLKWNDIPTLLGLESERIPFGENVADGDTFFEPERLACGVQLIASVAIREIWYDERLVCAPAYLVHPLASLVIEIVAALEDTSKKKKIGSSTPTRANGGTLLSNWIRERRRQEEGNQADENFEPTEEAIQRLMEMGFSRDHALDALENTRSNHLEIAMEYALSHPPPSPATVERRRAEREQRASQLQSSRDQNAEDSENREGEAVTHAGTQDVQEAVDVDIATPADDGGEEDKNTNRAKSALENLIDLSPQICSKILSRVNLKQDGNSSVTGQGDGDLEALTVVLSSFLLELSQRYADKRSNIADSLFGELANCVSNPTEDSDARLAALCHAAVLFMRAYPKTRQALLQKCITVSLVSRIQNVVQRRHVAADQGSAFSWPMWLAPSLLLLDILAQPVVAFTDTDAEVSFESSELTQVHEEHKRQAKEISIMAAKVFSTGANKTSADDATSSHVATASSESNAREQHTLFSSVPAFSHLLPQSLVIPSAEVCMNLLSEKRHPWACPPGVTQACLSLLLRLLRSPELSEKCLHDNVAESILSLPYECRFTGHTGLVTLVLRRLLEDRSTLQSAMEVEIKNTISKLHLKERGTNGDDGEPVSAPLPSFMEAITPLLCRDAMSFLKALALSTRVVPKKGTQANEAVVVLVSPEERAKNAEKISHVLKTCESDPLIGADVLRSDEYRRNSSSSKSRSKSNPRRGSLSKKGRKEKYDQPVSRQNQEITSHSASHLTNILINCIITSTVVCSEDQQVPFPEDKSFLWIADLLEILADLVLAVPACASAVHNYRTHRNKDKSAKSTIAYHSSHALKGCPSPPKNFVTFLLHSLLPQDRWSLRNDPIIWERKRDASDTLTIRQRRQKGYTVTKVCQDAARVLVALVARPGEGRRRVIADLVFALSGGQLGHGSEHAEDKNKDSVHVIPDCAKANELNALQAWGEVVLGLAAPRSNGKNLESTSSLSFENVRIMLEHGMAHALLYAMHRVRLLHPMASSTFGAILLPLEILTRSTVIDEVTKLIGDRSHPDETIGNNNKVSEEWEPIAVDHNETSNYEIIDAEYDFRIPEEGGEEHHGDGDDDEEIEMEDAEEIDLDDVSTNDDDASESEDDSESESDIEDHDENDGSEGEESESGPSEEVDDEGEWNVGYDEAFIEDNVAESGDIDIEVDMTDQMDGPPLERNSLEDGWTRIESNGFGGMLLGGMARRNGLPSTGETSVRARGFIDAAEAMIGTLLRTGEISEDALAELEGQLGIRITGSNIRASVARGGEGNDRGIEGITMGGVSTGSAVNNADSNRRNEMIGTLPHIHQRGQPDVGYSAFGNAGRSVDISSMEYVFGGPSMTAASRNYDTFSALENDDDPDPYPNLSQLDLQLFPRGPASAATARTQFSLHPLLCGVDLPPINSLVSDLLPHGIRATRRGQITTRRPGDWTNGTFTPGGYLVSTSNGNIIRSNRTHSGGPFASAVAPGDATGPIGWTDDGLPFDGTVENFSAAFERAFGELAERDTAITSQNDQMTLNDSQMSHHASDVASDSPPTLLNDNTSGIVPDTNTIAEAQPSEGDQVASSLAEGLRLSPGSEASTGSDHMSTGEADQHPTDASSGPIEQNFTSTVQEVGERLDNDSPVQNDASDELVNSQEESNADNRESVNEREGGLVCPPDIDPEVFSSLPYEMQQDLVTEHNVSQELAAELQGSTLDPEVLAALPEDMRREVIEQDRRERVREYQHHEPPADPARAEEMDSASFIASLAPELREEILLTADDAFLNSLPPNIVAEAQILRERASANQRGLNPVAAVDETGDIGTGNDGSRGGRVMGSEISHNRKKRFGKIRVEKDRDNVLYFPSSLSMPLSVADLKVLIRLQYLLSPVRPPKLLQKMLQNLCANPVLRNVIASAEIRLLHEDGAGAAFAVESYRTQYGELDRWRRSMDDYFSERETFPPSALIGAAPETPDAEILNMSISTSLLRRRQGVGTAVSMAANMPKSASGAISESILPPVVAIRILDTFVQLSKNSPRFSLYSLSTPLLEENETSSQSTCFENLLDLLDKPLFAKSSTNLEQLLTLLESLVSPLSHLSKEGEEDLEIPQRDIEAAEASGKEWVEVPRVAISQSRLQLLCSILRMETCKDSAFSKVNVIVRRLCRVDSNRGLVLSELASVANALGADALRDLKFLRVRLDEAASQCALRLQNEPDAAKDPENHTHRGAISSTVTLSTSTSEIKLLRVLQTLQALCSDSHEENSSTSNKKHENNTFVTDEMIHLLRQLHFHDLWLELTSCLKLVQVLEGVDGFGNEDKGAEDADTNDDVSLDETGNNKKKLRNSAAGLLTRFLPAIESFFIVNASATRPKDKGDGDDITDYNEDISLENLVGGDQLMNFVSANRVLLNALIRSSPTLLDKGLRAIVQVPCCRSFLDFDVKRQWFKNQVRRLRQQASRRYGSLRLHIRRKHVFEDAYHQLRLRNADEMRGRLHITFREEEGVDAGGLSREFFGILAKEIFNPNYALFTSTEDGCTFQPNPNSSINPDHLSYFRFVGRIVGKAVADGYLLDAHFTRSLYKHMLGIKPTHHDMEAIDPDYYRNLKTILEYNLDDIGLDLTFSIEDHSFGRSQVIDLIPNGRKVSVTEENKAKYVQLVCQHRMTTAIQSQIKAYLDGFYELVNPELIAVFTPKELELLISGLPDIDIFDLKRNTDYVGWKATDKEIDWFWNIMTSLSRKETASFLQFVTGSSKVPLAGFAELQGMRGVQKFSIHKKGGSKGALMSAHTCFNSLDLPEYDSEEEMKEKLLYAINEGAGGFLFA